MDVESTMQFILQSQAKTEARAAKHEARMEAMEQKHEARMEAMEQRIQEARARADSRLEAAENRFNRRMDVIGKLLQQGMKMLVQIQAAQKETDRTLKSFIASIKNGGNGKRPKNGR